MTASTETRRRLKERLRRREAVFAGWSTFAHPGIGEIFARGGFDFIGLDLEHGAAGPTEAQGFITAVQGREGVCLARIAGHDPTMSRRMLDAGADGLIVPMVEDSLQARAVEEWALYPPAGRRGFGVTRAQGYGFDFETYVRTWNESAVLIVQIESRRAVDRIDEILAVEAIDGVMVGPYDLSGSLGIPGQIGHPRVREAAARVVEACRRAGRACGIHIVDPDARSVDEAFAAGHTFVVLASDVFLLWRWTDRMGGLMAGRRRRERG